MMSHNIVFAQHVRTFFWAPLAHDQLFALTTHHDQSLGTPAFLCLFHKKNTCSKKNRCSNLHQPNYRFIIGQIIGFIRYWI